MQQELSYSREFDKLLILTTGEVLRESLGDLNAQIIFEYLEKRSCPMQEIPKKLEVFSMELRRLLGWNRGQLLGSAAILEETIARVLCFKLGVKFDERLPIAFSNYIGRLREVYCAKKANDAPAELV
jgi:hypothetical protein